MHLLLRLACALCLLGMPLARATSGTENGLAILEGREGGRLGVSALRVRDGLRIQYRAGERFPFCSTFKLIVAAEILSRSATDPDLLSRRLSFGREALAANSPICEKYAGKGMTVAELCAATLQYSDNTAANLLTGLLGGPISVNVYARSLDNRSFRLDRQEPDLNSAVPGDLRDTVTPADMAESLHRLVLGKALPEQQRAQLQDWLLGNTTGGTRIRAAVPTGWSVADKTGGGEYGTSNDVAVLWTPEGDTIVLAIYYSREKPGAEFSASSAVVREAAALVLGAMK